MTAERYTVRSLTYIGNERTLEVNGVTSMARVAGTGAAAAAVPPSDNDPEVDAYAESTHERSSE